MCIHVRVNRTCSFLFVFMYVYGVHKKYLHLYWTGMRHDGMGRLVGKVIVLIVIMVSF